ncbi:hypothetical protein BOTBODRAFT_125441 [Botryobasidium botryosum FD-172 SS1]|uniref:RNA helicase n=1 Tax=Botryobasidium botryosum (strain FD-172 SS1) TaxID=930990 RepID=A0A067N735_BOTB1|nr:hypothetical protein BOTBODRAFT_125441 [Botryobasidium botryosum FD-172 SS1]
MAKKKKLSLKPVARGFATTSQPKKVAPVAEEPELESDATGTSGPGGPAGGPARVAALTLSDAMSASASGPVITAAENEFDPVKVEEQMLQNIVDKLQDKTEREINRTLKSIETDRRYSKSFATFRLDPVMRDCVLQLAINEEQSNEEELPPLNEPEDKVLARIGLTFGVLRRLGFSEERLHECFRSLSNFELDEALSWLYLHCGEEELSVEKEMTDVRGTRSQATPMTPSFPSNHSHLSMRYDDASTPDHSDSEKNAARASPLVTQSPSTSGAPSGAVSPQGDASSGTSSPDLDPSTRFVHIKSKMLELTYGKNSKRGMTAEQNEQLRRLEAQLNEVRKEYLFSQKEADALFQAERPRIEKSLLEARLRSPPDSSSHSPPTPAVKKSAPPPLQLREKPVADVLDDVEDGSEGGFFGTMLDEMPATEASNTGTLITIHDMALPKHWAGRTPKLQLSELVKKTDKYAAIIYRNVGGASRAARAAVTIRWEGNRVDEWSMENDGCHNAAQAEQFVATVALHALSFTITPGFSLASTTGTPTYFRLLPPVFRDLWDELEVKRKEAEDAMNRQSWARLRDIVEPRLGKVTKASTKSKSTPSPSIDLKAAQNSVGGGDAASEQVQAEFAARQHRPLYREMLEQRNRLPIAAYRGQITAALETSQVMVLSGETGCGKSTQVPSMILEDQLAQGKHCKIYCTEPRRISAISLAQRVSKELGDPPGSVGTNHSIVGYSIRLESNISRNTKLAFVTNGIALRMLESGSGANGKGTAFDEVTHVIVDEVHERSIESDFLLLILKSLLAERPDLRVVLMSATVDAEKISAFFGDCPIIQVPGRTFPVDIRYLEDAVEFTQWTIKENSQYARRRNDKFRRLDWNEDTVPNEDDDELTAGIDAPTKLEKRYSPSTIQTVDMFDERLIPYELITRILEKMCFEDKAYASYSAAVLIFLPGLNEIRRLHEILSGHDRFGDENEFRVYPLHSTISSEGQSAVFDIPPPGVRKIVIATNIAETGITIPDITAVIDSGKHREMRFDEKRQVSRLLETFIAKSNAAQRRGRAGRVQSGLCFHLFTKARHDIVMADHPLPEMLRSGLADLALRIKILKVKIGNSIEDVLSRALDPPSSLNVQRAIASLVEVRALTASEEITPMGRLLSKLPTDVHLGKFLLMAALFRCLDPALTIAATLNLKSPFITPFGFEAQADAAKNSFAVENSDFLTIHNAFATWRRVSTNSGSSAVRKFCRESYLSHQSLQQIEDQRQQFLGYLIDAGFVRVDRAFTRELSKARYSRGNRTRFIYLPSELDQSPSDNVMLNAALAAGLYPRVLSLRNGIQTMNNAAAAFHPSSINHRRPPKDFGVNYMCYFTLMHSKKLYAWETTPVDDLALLLLCGDAEFKLISDTAIIDRKIKFCVSPKDNIALKHLRGHLEQIIATQMKGKRLSESQETWNNLALEILGHVKAEDAEARQVATPTILVAGGKAQG